ncbi:hypothetical protein BGZ95_002636, partial [Linnemannia exigua]
PLRRTLDAPRHHLVLWFDLCLDPRHRQDSFSQLPSWSRYPSRRCCSYCWMVCSCSL